MQYYYWLGADNVRNRHIQFRLQKWKKGLNGYTDILYIRMWNRKN